MSIRRTHPGRPRLVPSNTAAPPREQVLHAAAQLFVTKGFAATSTREIADKVGIRQASLYYHFTGKDEILAELLERSVRPTVDRVDQIEQLTASASPRQRSTCWRSSTSRRSPRRRTTSACWPPIPT
jgi:AcrR family transcriptional regulator